MVWRRFGVAFHRQFVELAHEDLLEAPGEAVTRSLEQDGPRAVRKAAQNRVRPVAIWVAAEREFSPFADGAGDSRLYGGHGSTPMELAGR